MRYPEPEGERAEQPRGDEDSPAAGVTELGLGDDDERERAREDEEEDRVEALVGGRADLDLPGPRIDVLVELADPDPPEEKADDHRDGGREGGGGGGAEGAVDERGRRHG